MINKIKKMIKNFIKFLLEDTKGRDVQPFGREPDYKRNNR